jgi:hypothetical protein
MVTPQTSPGSRDFSQFGRDAQEMIISQLQSIELEKIGPKSIAHMGKSLISLVQQSHKYQEESTDDITRNNYITIREMCLMIMEDILERFQELSNNCEIAEWDRASVLGLLAQISKVCHEEQRRDAAEAETAGVSMSSDLLNDLLGVSK